MPRLARAVFPGHRHHVTQRGNGRATTFFDDEDYARYRDRLGQHCAAAGVEIWAWVLKPNHVHLILVPPDADGIRRALAALHRRYAGYVHAKLKRTGHFWQGRFGCVAMDEEHLGAALRYVALDPVRAKLVRHAADWPWSSLHAQLGADDGLTTSAVAARYPDFAALIAAGEDPRRRGDCVVQRGLAGRSAAPRSSSVSSGRAAARLRRGSEAGLERKKMHCHPNFTVTVISRA